MKASKLVSSEDMALIFDGDEPEEERTLNLTVNPGALTPAEEARLRDAGDDAVEPVVDLLLSIVVKWDLNDDDGELIPLTKDAVMDVPIIALGKIMRGISKTLADDADAEGKASAAT